MTPRTNSWAAILAGGKGSRMRPLIQRWLGHDLPKQYCTFVGARCMLQHALERGAALVPTEQMVTVIGSGHRNFLHGSVGDVVPGSVIEQPRDCGTAAGILLPTALVMDHDPTATLFVLPSDHFIHPRERFLEHLRFAGILAQQHPKHLVMLGAPADRPEPDYGWILQGEIPRNPVSHRVLPDPREVLHYHEKPTEGEAAELYRRGGLWNTMIVAVRVDTLWELGWRHLPHMMRRFEELRAMLGSARDRLVPDLGGVEAISHIYRGLDSADFSRDLVQRTHDRTLVLPMEGIEWSDWGRPERVVETLNRLGKQPAFPLDAVG